MYVSELYFYPIKSARGIALDRAQLDARGFQHDRRWMLVDEDGVFITQREAQRMALIDVVLAEDSLQVSAPQLEPLRIPVAAQGPLMRCTIFNDVVEALPVSAAADEWFSSYLGRRCRLVYMPGETRRIVDRTYLPEERIVGFADAFPLLIIGQRSLDLLNGKLAARGQPAVPMQRFRPNIVVAGAEAHAEDEWSQIRIGEVEIDVVKPCARCMITTVDVDTAAAGPEPLRTLTGYRKRGSKVMFGQNAAHRQHGVISVGDAVSVVSWRL